MSRDRSRSDSAKGTKPSIPPRRRSGLGTAFYTLITHISLIPFLILCFIAPGTMAVPSDQGLPRIVICSGYGPVEVILAPDGSVKVPNAASGSEDKATNLCDWAFHSQASVDIVTFDEPVLHRTASPVCIPASISEHPARIAVLCPSTRGPPLQAFLPGNFLSA